VPKHPIPALPEFSLKKEWTEGDTVTWQRWCADFGDWVGEYLYRGSEEGIKMGRGIENDCWMSGRQIERRLSEHGWAKSCAIQYEHLDLLRREPDPYMCE
jgi:hypothetical protein